jgi:putative heme iron utilization protein
MESETNFLLELLSPVITTAEDKFDKIKKELAEKGQINLILANGDIIKDVKSIAKWGTGLFYGFVAGQENFYQSISLNEII